jgi:hypothetical protein
MLQTLVQFMCLEGSDIKLKSDLLSTLPDYDTIDSHNKLVNS